MISFEQDSASPESPVDAAGVRETIPISELALYDDIQADFDAYLNEDDALEADWDNMVSEDLEMDWSDETVSETGLVNQWGTEMPEWIEFSESFASFDKYNKEVVLFLLFHEKQAECTEAALVPNMMKYFKLSYRRQGDDSVASEEVTAKASTTLRGILSIYCKFWKYTQRGDLKVKAPLLLDLLAQWDKVHKLRQSKVFSKQNFGECCIALAYYICTIHTNPSLYTLLPTSYLQLTCTCGSTTRTPCCRRPMPLPLSSLLDAAARSARWSWAT
jgi:hypothetical protein